MWWQSTLVVPPLTQAAVELTEQRPASPAVFMLPFVPHPSVELHKPPPPAGVSVERRDRGLRDGFHVPCSLLPPPCGIWSTFPSCAAAAAAVCVVYI